MIRTKEKLRTLLSYGNTKLPKDTAIFNMTPATTCPAKELGLCKLCPTGGKAKCYALKPEHMYPDTLPFRQRQEEYYDIVTAKRFTDEFVLATAKKRMPVKRLRISEAGDFKGQKEFNKMVKISDNLKDELGIRTYVYTAMDTKINFSKRGSLRVIGSNVMIDAQFIAVHNPGRALSMLRYVGIKAVECKGDCRVCDFCDNPKYDKLTIVNKIH